MLSAEVYKIIHLLGVFMVFVALGGLCLHAVNGGSTETNRARRLVALTYGIGLLVILVGAFGWLARTGVMAGGLPGWVWVKLALWLALGGLLSLPGRRPELGRVLWFVGPAVGVLAAAIAITKPF